jgi:CO/xanthine dehydrogenase FAD-binding subunit
MLLKLVEYHWAEHIDDALLLLARLDMKTVPLAGGTYLLGLQDESIEAVVDLRDLGLTYISEDRRGIHIGAMTTLQSMADSSVLKEFAMGLLARSAAVSSSSRLIRNCATIGGTLGAGIASQADLLTALVALEAEVVVRSGSQTQVGLKGGSFERPGFIAPEITFKGRQERHIPCSEFYLTQNPRELIIEVIVPHPGPSAGTSLIRIGRTATDAALLNAAAMVEVDHGIYQKVRLAIGGVNMEPIRLRLVERHLEGQPVDPLNSQALLAALHAGMVEFRPPSDNRVSHAYRRVSGMNLVYNVLEEAINVSRWRGVVSSERSL